MDGLYRRVAWHFGPRRMREFARLFNTRETTTVLDVGGTTLRWQMAKIDCTLFICNFDRGVTECRRFLVADGQALPFADRSFDIVFSNSVIEHVGDWRA